MLDGDPNVMQNYGEQAAGAARVQRAALDDLVDPNPKQRDELHAIERAQHKTPREPATSWGEMARRWPKITFCIVTNEFCERFSFYGERRATRTPVIVEMHKQKEAEIGCKTRSRQTTQRAPLQVCGRSSLSTYSTCSDILIPTPQLFTMFLMRKPLVVAGNKTTKNKTARFLASSISRPSSAVYSPTATSVLASQKCAYKQQLRFRQI